ncbi:Ulp1-like peptidase [Cucumis melo var. makuwa]|uniref:Ulp1-like peptidase n=1 Tax=Cucumis melo var. makuwa TaxID=1194695 RepID=A0A5D3BF09_CUCMM|nr:Ulp1-like peptidase [Cucumis melo var. makuwa]
MAVPNNKYFPAIVSCQVHKIGNLIKDKLTKEQLQMFNKTMICCSLHDQEYLEWIHRPQLSPQREQSQTVANQSEMHPITNKKRCRLKKSNDKEQQSHSKSYKKLKKEIKEVRKNLSTLTSIVCRMDDTIRKQPLELSEMKQMLSYVDTSNHVVGISLPLFILEITKSCIEIVFQIFFCP